MIASAKVALFSLGGRRFALAVEQIDQIVTAPKVFSLPLMPQGFLGVFLFREEAVPLYDLREEFGLGRSSPPPVSSPFAVVMNSEVGKLGLPADQVGSLVGIGQGTVEGEAEGEKGDGRAFVCENVRYPFFELESIMSSLPDRTSPGVRAEGHKED